MDVDYQPNHVNCVSLFFVLISFLDYVFLHNSLLKTDLQKESALELIYT
jgi:hypothetical protein